MVILDSSKKEYNNSYRFLLDCTIKEIINIFEKEIPDIHNLSVLDNFEQTVNDYLLINLSYCDEDIITTILNNREEQYILDYNENTECFEVTEVFN